MAENRAALRAALSPDAPLNLLPADGGWSAILRVPAVHTDEDWALLLLERDGMLVHPGYFFDLVGGAYLVLSLLPEPATFQAAARALVTGVRALAESHAPTGDATAEHD